MTQRTTSRIALGLGIMSGLTIAIAHLALTDIYHHEADVTLEWRVLCVSFLIIIAFHVFAPIVAWKAAGLSDSPGE